MGKDEIISSEQWDASSKERKVRALDELEREILSAIEARKKCNHKWLESPHGTIKVCVKCGKRE